MKRYRLSNGLTILFDKRSTTSVCVEVMVNVGSNDEQPAEAGLSHFLEHMLFEGTKKRLSSREIANEIEQYGAEFNAYTTGDRTAYYIKIINKHVEKAVEILADMIRSSRIDPETMRKEQAVVVKEINMVTDDPRQHQWILLQQNLFSKHPARNPTYGSKESVMNFTREQVLRYYRQYYVPDNMIISISGNVNNVQKLITKYFGPMKKKTVAKRTRPHEPQRKKPIVYVEKRNIQNSYMVLGYKTVARVHKDSYVLDVIAAVLGRGQSGWIFNEIRNKRGLAYQVGVQPEYDWDHGYFAVYCSLDKSKIRAARKIIGKQFERLKSISAKELHEAKTFIEGHYALTLEDNFHNADTNAYYENMQDVSLARAYIARIQKVSVADVKLVVTKYLHENYTLIAIEQK